MNDTGILTNRDPGSVLVHDRLAMYWNYGTHHAVCGAHLLRDLAGVAEHPAHHRWANQLADVLTTAHRHFVTARNRGDTALTPLVLAEIDWG